MAIGGKLLGRVIEGPTNALAGKAALSQAADGQRYDAMTAKQLAKMQRVWYHPVSLLGRAGGIASQIQMRFAKYGMAASALVFLLPAVNRSIAKGQFEDIEDYKALKEKAGQEPEQQGISKIWHMARVKSHKLIAGLENIPQSLTFNQIRDGVRQNDGHIAQGIWATLTETMSRSAEETKQLRALQREDAEPQEERLQGRWERMTDVSGNARRVVNGLKDTSLLDGAVKVGQVAGTTISTYNTVTDTFKDLKMLQLLHQQTTGQKKGKIRLLFARNLPEVVAQARKELVRSYTLAGAVDMLSMAVTRYVAKHKVESVSLSLPALMAGLGHVLNNVVSPYVKNSSVILPGLRQLNYENPSVEDYAQKVALLHPGVRDAGLSSQHPFLQKLGEHMAQAEAPLSTVPGLIQSGWVDAALKEIAHQEGKSISPQMKAEQPATPQRQPVQQLGGFVARYASGGRSSSKQEKGFREIVRTPPSGELAGAGHGVAK